jgi:predicted transcriptional regulator
MALKLTRGERIMIGRRRDGHTQGSFAEEQDISQPVVSRWESDELEPPKDVLKRYKRLGKLSQGEQALIMRRRLGLSIRDAAKMHGISHFHLIRIEADERQSDAYTTFIHHVYEKGRIEHAVNH